MIPPRPSSTLKRDPSPSVSNSSYTISSIADLPPPPAPVRILAGKSRNRYFLATPYFDYPGKCSSAFAGRSSASSTPSRKLNDTFTRHLPFSGQAFPPCGSSFNDRYFFADLDRQTSEIMCTSYVRRLLWPLAENIVAAVLARRHQVLCAFSNRRQYHAHGARYKGHQNLLMIRNSTKFGSHLGLRTHRACFLPVNFGDFFFCRANPPLLDEGKRYRGGRLEMSRPRPNTETKCLSIHLGKARK